jgi:hypothetical protein
VTKPIARDPIYRRRGFDAEIIELCVRWYISYRLSYRDLVELMADRGVAVSHTTIIWWVIRYVPEFEKRWNRFARPVGRSWRWMRLTSPFVAGGITCTAPSTSRARRSTSCSDPTVASPRHRRSSAEHLLRTHVDRGRSPSMAMCRVGARCGDCGESIQSGAKWKFEPASTSTTSSRRTTVRSSDGARPWRASNRSRMGRSRFPESSWLIGYASASSRSVADGLLIGR